MNTFNWKKILPHVIAIVVFFLIAVIYCRPSLSGEVLSQNDITHWKGMAQESFEYKAQHGHMPLWNTHLFSGMPNYQIAMEGKSITPDWNAWIRLGLPKPASYFFIASVCFYILSMVMGFDVLLAVFVSLAFAFATYNPVIIVAGHETKMSAIAYMPGLLAGILLLYKRKYLLGLGVAALFATLEIGANHYQVTYYLLLVLAIMTVFYVIKWVRAGEWKHMFIALSLALLSGLVGVGNSALSLLTTSEYAKYTMRGGKTIDAKSQPGNAKEVKQTAGLDEDYAFMWSISKAEAFVLAMPNAFGASSTRLDDDDQLVANNYEEDSKVGEAFSEIGAPAQYASQLPKYWGGLEGTSGPAYIGALICVLAMIGFFIAKDGIARWWILAASVFGIILACGKFMPGINGFLFEHLPLYNKFRAPSMALVIPQLVLPLMAGVTLQQLTSDGSLAESLRKNKKPLFYGAAALVVLAVLIYILNDYSSAVDTQLKSALGEKGSSVINAIIQERKSMFGAGIMHLVFFTVIALAGILLYLKGAVKPVVIFAAFAFLNFVDLMNVDSKYLNAGMYQEPNDLQSSSFTPTPAIAQIQRDKDPHYRVFNLSTGDPFQDAITSYFVRSIGGYHAAKLRIYQDVIESQFSGSINPQILNMLDTRYIITQGGQSQPGQQAPAGGVLQRNPDALGAAWFVKTIQYANSPVDALNGLGHLQPKDTAIVYSSDRNRINVSVQPDTAAAITLTKFDNDTLIYTTKSATPQFAVFSEVYYPAGWNAYVDGEKTDYVNADYFLRGLSVPAGTHKIAFIFEPASYHNGNKIVVASNGLLYLILLVSIFGVIRSEKKKTA